MKKQNFSQFIGIDVSKLTFDVAIINKATNQTSSYVFDNTQKGIKTFLRRLKNQKMDLSRCIICMEHTGVFGKLLITKLVEKQAYLCVEMSLKIMRILGLQRGKNDKVDAIRIAKYVIKNYNELQVYVSVPEFLDKIKTLLTIRERFIKSKTDLVKYPNELTNFAPNLAKIAHKNIKKSLKTFNDEIKRIELEIQTLVISDKELNTAICLVTSVVGIGKITALYLCCFTNIFTRYDNAKQLACYCGVVPFEYSSGTSISKRSRVHHMANKTLKKQRHLCAMSAIQHDPQIKDYYNRKIQEGKPKMLVINHVRNKLIHRVCAIVKQQQPYVKIAA